MVHVSVQIAVTELDNTGTVWLSVYQGLTTERMHQRLDLVYGEMRSLSWYKKHFLIPHLGTLWCGDIAQSRKWGKRGLLIFMVISDTV